MTRRPRSSAVRRRAVERSACGSFSTSRPVGWTLRCWSIALPLVTMSTRSPAASARVSAAAASGNGRHHGGRPVGGEPRICIRVGHAPSTKELPDWHAGVLPFEQLSALVAPARATSARAKAGLTTVAPDPMPPTRLLRRRLDGRAGCRPGRRAPPGAAPVPDPSPAGPAASVTIARTRGPRC